MGLFHSVYLAMFINNNDNPLKPKDEDRFKLPQLKGYGEEEPKFSKEKERKINEMVKNSRAFRRTSN